jgi:hypothetical protein
VTDQLASFMAFDIKSYLGIGAPLGFLEQGADVGGLIQGLTMTFLALLAGKDISFHEMD